MTSTGAMVFAAMLLLTAPAIPCLAQAGAGAVTPVPTGSHTATKAATQHTVHSRRQHHGRVKVSRAKVKELPVAIPVAPPPPPPPVPPAQQAARPAKITLQSDTLGIQADNSSLTEILTKVSRDTGMAIEGLNHDERVYGNYGPAPVATTLAQLLDGAGYNYVIVDGGKGKAPAKLLLTTPGAAPASAAAAPITTTSNAPTAAPEPADPSEAAHPKTPQQIFDELRRMHPSGR